jgi:oligoendopeptidase F
MAQTTLPQRSEADPKYTWDVESIFPNASTWEVELEAVRADLEQLRAFKGKLHDPKQLLAFLEARDALGLRLDKVYTFASMGSSVDAEDGEASARTGRSGGLMAQFREATAFSAPEMLEIGRAGLEAFSAQEAGLAVYRHHFDELEVTRKHTRGAEVEALLGAVSDPFRTAARTHGTLANADLKFKPAVSMTGESFEVAQSSIGNLLHSDDRTLRLEAWRSYSDGHLAFKNTMANALEAGVKQDVFRARARNYSSSLDAALTPNFIPMSVFHNLIDTFKRYIPVWHRYWSVRRRLLGLDVLSEADVFAPLSKNQPKLTYEEACQWILEGMRPLGDEYVSIAKKGMLEQRWVDVYPNKGKRLGAFSTGGQGMHPFIFMSFTGGLGSLSTLAHELGHSMHTYYTAQHQPPIYNDYGLFVAEVASNFDQAMVREHLFQKNADPEFQLAVLEEAFQNFHRYFFVMPTLARFELEIHERVERGEALTADSLIALCAELFKEGYGPEVEFDHDRIGSVWMKFSTHLYSNFYVYQYATGISGAHALALGILRGEKSATQYLEFLKAGSSLYPLEALRLAGVDLSSPEPVIATFEVLKGYVDRLEAILEARGSM